MSERIWAGRGRFGTIWPNRWRWSRSDATGVEQEEEEGEEGEVVDEIGHVITCCASHRHHRREKWRQPQRESCGNCHFVFCFCFTPFHSGYLFVFFKQNNHIWIDVGNVIYVFSGVSLFGKMAVRSPHPPGMNPSRSAHLPPPSLHLFPYHWIIKTASNRFIECNCVVEFAH